MSLPASSERGERERVCRFHATKPLEGEVIRYSTPEKPSSGEHIGSCSVAGYRLFQRLGDAEADGPMPVGVDDPAHVIYRADEVDDIVNPTAVAVVDVQER